MADRRNGGVARVCPPSSLSWSGAVLLAAVSDTAPQAPKRPSQSSGTTEPGNATKAPRTIESLHLEHRFKGHPINTDTMSDLPILAATLLANFATVRIPRCDSIWISSVPNPSPSIGTGCCHVRSRVRP